MYYYFSQFSILLMSALLIAEKMKFLNKDFFKKYEQILRKRTFVNIY